MLEEGKNKKSIKEQQVMVRAREMAGQEQSERRVRELSKNKEQVVPVVESRLGDRRPWTLWGRSLEPSCMDIPRERLGGRPGRELKRKRRKL